MTLPEKPLVSIIIPCFNGQDYLEETLASVYGQTLTDWELILIDDGSTDRTGDILRQQIQRSRGRIIFRSTPNQGISRARNLGITLSSGRFIQFLDADDLLEPDSLAVKVDALEKVQADVAYGDFQFLVSDGAGEFVKGEIQTRNLDDFDQDIETAVMQGFWVPPAGLLYRKTLVDRVGGFNLSLPICQDGRFMFDAARAGARWARVEGIHTYYRVHEAAISKKDKSAFFADYFAHTRSVEDLWSKTGEPLSGTRRDALLKRYFWIGSHFYEHDRAMFGMVWDQIKQHDPKFIPPSTPAMKLFSRLLGYPRAEAVALAWRRVKRFFRDGG